MQVIAPKRKMALKNFTEDENIKTVQALNCSAEFFRGVESELIFLSALNIFLSITAFLGNTLILVALHKETSLHPPSKLLYRNLAITDLCVGIIVEPAAVIYWSSVVKERRVICYYANWIAVFSSHTLCAVSLLTLTAISVDRLLALLLGLRYRQVVTLRRTFITVIASWVFSIVSACTNFWNPLIFSWYKYIGTALCLVTTIFAYTKNFRHYTSQPNSCACWPCSEPCFSKTTEPSNSTEHSSIQKGSVQCTMGAGNIGCLLFAVCYRWRFGFSKRHFFIRLPCLAIYGCISFVKLVIKPVAVLLEDERSKASC